MYKHSAESILETTKKRFVSKADKDKYDGYNDRLREKNDIYTKEELLTVEKEFSEIKEVNSGNVVSIENTIEGQVKVLELQGKTVQDTEVINIVPYMENGTISAEGEFIAGDIYDETTGENLLIATPRFVSVKHGDVLRYFNNDKSRAVNIRFYDGNGIYLSHYYLDENKTVTVPVNAENLRLHQYKKNHEDLRLEITRPRYDIMSSVGDKREDGRYNINLLSCGANIINCPSLIEKEMTSSGNSFATRVICVKIEPNTEYTLSGLYTKNTPMYNGGISVGLFEEIPAQTDKWFLTSESDGTMQIIVMSEASEKDLTKVFNSDKYKYFAIYLGVATGVEHSHIAKIENLMLVKGNKILPYEEYKEDSCTIISDIPLEGLDGYSDRLMNKDGKWVIEKNIKSVVFDGSKPEEYLYLSSQITLDKTVLFSTQNIKDIIPSSPLISSRLPYDSMQWSNDIESLYCYDNKDVDIRISKNTASTPGQLRSWLEKNNLLIKYVTTKPEYIELPKDQQIILNSFAGGTTVRTDNHVPGYVTIEVAKTLQSTINMNVKNILELSEEVERLSDLENTASNIIDSDNTVYIENTSRGLLDNITVSGRTLINIATITDIGQLSYAGNANSSDVEKTVSSGYVKWSLSPGAGIMYPKILIDSKSYGTIIPGKKYTIKYKMKASRNIQQGFTIANSDAYVDIPNNQMLKYDIIRHTLNAVVNMYEVNVCIEAKTPILQKEQVLAIGFGRLHSSDVTEWVEIHDLMILEGDYTEGGLSYFEGMRSVEGDLSIKAINSNKNLCKWTGTTTATANKSGKDVRWIPFKPISNKYTIKFLQKGETITTHKIAYRLRDKYGAILGCRKVDTNYAFITLTDINVDLTFNDYAINYKDVEYLEIFWNNLLTEDVVIDEVVAIDGHISDYDTLTYIPQQAEEKPLMYLDTDGVWKYPILRAVNDTIKDTVEKHSDGKYYYHRKCKETTLNGSEPWQIHTAIPENDEYCFFIAHKNDTQILFNAHEICVKSKNFTGVSRRLLAENFGNSICINSGETGFYYYGIKILKSLLSDTTADALKQYLTNNPLTVVQSWEEEVFECSPIDVSTYEKGTIIYMDNSVISPNLNFRVNNNIGEIVNSLKDKITVLESDLFEHSIEQNKILLNSFYSADSTGLSLDIATLAITEDSTMYSEEDDELFSLIYKNIIVGRENYDRNTIEEIIDFYTMVGKLSFESATFLFDTISSQHDFTIEE